MTPIAQPLTGRPPCLTADRLHQPAEPLGELCRCRVPALLGEPRVAGDVQEAHGRWMLEARMQSRRGELRLQAVDDRAGPGQHLLEVVHPDQGMLGQDAHPVGEVDAQDLVGPPAGLGGGREHLGVLHQAVSVSVIRRRLSPWTRRSRSMAAG